MRKIHKGFIDTLRLHVRGGNGGMGLPRLGGIGGNGGNIYVEGKEGYSLINVRQSCPEKRWAATDGSNSRKYRICGEPAPDLNIKVPTGTCVWLEPNRLIGEVNQEGERVLVAQGGVGGCVKNQFNGQKGQAHMIKLELKLLADVGLVGFPNAGKSTLLTAISRAKPKVASYPFTTVKPTIGIVEFPDLRRISIADLPGLIEGAWANVGMGHSFLRHVERTKLLLFVVDINGFRLSPKYPHRSATENVLLLNRELELYSPELLSKPAMLMVNKMDCPNSESKLADLLNDLKNMEEVSQRFPEEYQPKQHMVFDDVIPCSARENPPSILYLRQRLRDVLDLHQDLKDRRLELEEEAAKTLQQKLLLDGTATPRIM